MVPYEYGNNITRARRLGRYHSMNKEVALDPPNRINALFGQTSALKRFLALLPFRTNALFGPAPRSHAARPRTSAARPPRPTSAPPPRMHKGSAST